MNHLVCMVWGGPSAGTERARLGPLWVVGSRVEPRPLLSYRDKQRGIKPCSQEASTEACSPGPQVVFHLRTRTIEKMVPLQPLNIPQYLLWCLP